MENNESYTLVNPVPGPGPSNTGDVQTSVIGVINMIIGALGIVAVVVVLIGGIGYMTSAGDASKVKKAKDTILYGLLGLLICALSFAIVNFVIVNVINK